MTPQPSAPGWYPDPSGKGQRYWDGNTWGPPAPPGRAKKRRKWPWILLIVVVLFTIGKLSSTGTGSNTSSSSSSSSSAPAAAAPSAGIGQEVRDGKFAFVVNSVDLSNVAGDLSNEFEHVRAQGQFVNVHLTVANTSNQPQTFSASDQKLTISGREFRPNDEAAVWTHSVNVDINPGNNISAVLSFDVPPGAAGTGGVLELHDSGLSGGVSVNMPPQPGA